MKKCLFLLFLLPVMILAQPWQQDNEIFNPSGIPSLSFSQPRFVDLDTDGDMDFFLGNTNSAPLFICNTGTPSLPHFVIGDNLLANISFIDAELAVCADMNADGKLDLITGGYTGLHLFLNTGTVQSPVYTEQLGYFTALEVGNSPVPDIADVDYDGDMDLVLGLSEDGAVRVYLNTGTSYDGIFVEESMQLIGDVGLYAYPIFCDMDNDGDQDILCGRDEHGFVYYQNNGTTSSPVWENNSSLFSGLGNTTYWNSPDLVDLDNDTDYDLIFGTADGPLQYYVNTGTLSSPQWQENTNLFGGIIDAGGASSPILFDFDGDVDLDLICGTQLGDIKYYKNIGTVYAPAWQEESSYFSSIDHSIYSAITLGDVDADGLTDAIVGDLSGNLYFHKNTGTGFIQQNDILPPISVGGWSVPRLIDMELDGDLDLAVGNEAGNIYFYQNNGTVEIPQWTVVSGYFGNIDVGSNCSPTFGDLDENGRWDLLAGDLFGSLHCYLYQNHNWVPNTELFSGIETDQNAAPALADLDHDGDLDLVIGDYDGTFKFYRNQKYSGAVLNPPLNLLANTDEPVTISWEEPQASTSPLEHYNIYLDDEFVDSTTYTFYTFLNWNFEVAHIVKVTAQYVAGESLPAMIEIPPTPINDECQSISIINIYPNPFTNITNINFTLKTEGNASVAIYNLKGQQIKSWDTLPRGNHNLIWDGKDMQGRSVANGIFLLQIKTPQGITIRKISIIK
ncbi:MAG TPA: FG-GAP-like repeat-containing protein [Candidatus Syntrophosphaera sp.]|jgi:hypothetical protein|nr:FG-GAP-like repeat-containing protein [Candidatus Syntrophosphaera sp.]